MIRIAITGPESSGKSDLAKALAQHFDTTHAPEYARIYLEKNGPEYAYQDLDEICRGQIAQEQKALAAAKRICFFDTDMLVLKIWSKFRFGRVSNVIEQAMSERKYDHYLLCKPDLPWSLDPLRESPSDAERNVLFTFYRNELESGRCSYSIVEGEENERLHSAVSALERLKLV
ncbi:AAA family ATPase [Cryomorphaceae bacterium 1068]|nr:AAA family ATPase [Cryomorphaceae bacterium 1068]